MNVSTLQKFGKSDIPAQDFMASEGGSVSQFEAVGAGRDEVVDLIEDCVVEERVVDEGVVDE